MARFALICFTACTLCPEPFRRCGNAGKTFCRWLNISCANMSLPMGAGSIASRLNSPHNFMLTTGREMSANWKTLSVANWLASGLTLQGNGGVPGCDLANPETATSMKPGLTLDEMERQLFTTTLEASGGNPPVPGTDGRKSPDGAQQNQRIRITGQEVLMSWLHSANLAVLERYLDVQSMRQILVSTNIADVDTPGYHTRDIDFRGELQRAMSGQADDGSSPFVVPVRGLIARPDGNNVNVDRESMLLSEVQLQFKAATTVLRAEYAQIHTAIREGQ